MLAETSKLNSLTLKSLNPATHSSSEEYEEWWDLATLNLKSWVLKSSEPKQIKPISTIQWCVLHSTMYYWNVKTNWGLD